MIKYDGLRKDGQVYFIKFTNERNFSVEVPLDELCATRISTYLEQISTSAAYVFERKNDEDSE